jgi:Protein of unknown function (DUF1572)
MPHGFYREEIIAAMAQSRAGQRRRARSPAARSGGGAPIAGRRLAVQNLGMTHEFTDSYISDAARVFRMYKRLGERALAQISDEQLTIALDTESNSIAIIVKHMSGNMRSRWTDFLTTDGEKPDRNRDAEFRSPATTRVELMGQWDAGWKCVFDALAPLTDADLGGTVLIRNELHSVMQAVNRQLAHYCYHVGQIVFLAKHFASDHWTSLSVPRGKSAEIHSRMQAGAASKLPEK